MMHLGPLENDLESSRQMKVLGVLAAGLIWTGVLGHTIDLGPDSRDCFFEDLHAEDKMTVTYQVAGGGNLDIDFWLKAPGDRTLATHNKKDTGTYSFTAEQDGRYTYCFSNEMSSVTTKTVSFNVHGIMYIEDEGHVAPIEKEIRTLSHNLEQVRDEQQLTIQREKIHRDTCESINDRIKYWNIIQMLSVISVGGFQVYYLRRFFEVKR